MEWELKYNHNLQLVVIRVYGDKDVSATVEMLKRTLEFARLKGVNKYLVDFSKSVGQYKFIDIHRNISKFKEYGFEKTDKIAFYDNHLSIENEFTSNVASFYGWENIRYFESRIEAQNWLY